MVAETDFPTESETLGLLLRPTEFPSIQVNLHGDQPTLKIYQDGRVFWKDHFIDSDDEFKSAIIEFSRYIIGKCPRCQNVV